MSSSVTPFRELGLAMASKKKLVVAMASSVVGLWSGLRLQLVLLLALEVPPSSIRRPSPFGPSFLFLFVKVKKIDLSGTRTCDDRSSKLGPLDCASQSSSEVGCALKGA